MLVYVKKEKCIGCGKCFQLAKEVFDFDDEGIAFNKLDDNNNTLQIPTSLEKAVKLAEHACPTDAIISK